MYDIISWYSLGSSCSRNRMHQVSFYAAFFDARSLYVSYSAAVSKKKNFAPRPTQSLCCFVFCLHCAGPSLQVRQVDTYHSASSSRSHSPARTDSTSGSRPTSGTPREEMNKINKIKINTARDEKRTASEDRAGTPARSRSLANRRKTPSFSSDSTLSSDSDIERSAQRNSGPRHRRGHPSSSRTKDQNTNTTGARQISHRQVLVGANRAKKTVSWNESPKDTNLTNVNRQIPTERPRVPPKPPARTTSRDSGVAGYVQKDRNTASRNGVNRNMGRGVVPSVIVQKPVKTVAVSSWQLISDQWIK